ncbi:NlpC/P60 family protein [Rhodococcus sp. X156]|uniref:NlpC/P60 family protein n=1 Tax=Rhodococcus sp. X156 TaxID=2499145 RepID=UPI000FD77959|nr:NlpC/P60 family protein [Rhodococcus sp. X156]
MAAVAIATMSATPASADPVLPDNATQAEQELARLGHDAEVVNEQLLGAQVDLDAKQSQRVDAETRLGSAQESLRVAQSEQEQFRGTVDALTSASYQGARLNKLSALMISESPQDLLDQMSGLDVLAADTNDRVQKFSAASAQAATAATDARSATAAAKAAADAAALVQADLRKKQDELSTRATAVRAKLASLTEAERVRYAGAIVPAGFVSPVPTTPVTPPAEAASQPAAPAAAVRGGAVAPAAPAVASTRSAGSGRGATALQAAMSKLGSPYVYGATGPGSFDCSGLTQWAFRQAGTAIPRTAAAQAGGGTPVSRDQLQPGDLVFFYSPVSHVGIYAGGGNMVHAPTEGQPVKVAPMGNMPYTGARRY